MIWLNYTQSHENYVCVCVCGCLKSDHMTPRALMAADAFRADLALPPSFGFSLLSKATMASLKAEWASVFCSCVCVCVCRWV